MHTCLSCLISTRNVLEKQFFFDVLSNFHLNTCYSSLVGFRQYELSYLTPRNFVVHKKELVYFISNADSCILIKSLYLIDLCSFVLLALSSSRQVRTITSNVIVDALYPSIFKRNNHPLFNYHRSSRIMSIRYRCSR